MNLTYILIDFENVKPTAADLNLIRGADNRVRLFHGPHQNKFDADIVKALERHLTTLLGKETLQEAAKDLIARLQREGIAVANGKKIEYKIPDGKG